MESCMRRPILMFLSSVTVVLGCASDPAPDPSGPEGLGFSSEKLDELTTAMHRQVDEGRLAGIVTLLVRHGAVVDLDAYGMKSVATGAPMTRDTIFRLYSQTKPITAAAMMILYDEGKWGLE